VTWCPQDEPTAAAREGLPEALALLREILAQVDDAPTDAVYRVTVSAAWVARAGKVTG